MIQVKLEPGLHKDKDKKKPHIKKPLNAFMLYMKVRFYYDNPSPSPSPTLSSTNQGNS